MTVHICTIGWENPDRIVGPMKKYRPTRVYLVHGKRTDLDKGKIARERAKEIEGQLGVMIDSTRVEIDPHDLVDIFKNIEKIIEEESAEGNGVYINITGGTKILVGSTLMAAVAHMDKILGIYYGKPKVYTDTKQFGSEGYSHRVVLPIFSPELEKLKQNEKFIKVLKTLYKQKEHKVPSIDELSSLAFPMKYKASTLKGKTEKKKLEATTRYYLDVLGEYHFIETEKVKRKLTIKLTPSGVEAARVLLETG